MKKMFYYQKAVISAGLLSREKGKWCGDDIERVIRTIILFLLYIISKVWHDSPFFPIQLFLFTAFILDGNINAFNKNTFLMNLPLKKELKVISSYLYIFLFAFILPFFLICVVVIIELLTKYAAFSYAFFIQHMYAFIIIFSSTLSILSIMSVTYFFNKLITRITSRILVIGIGTFSLPWFSKLLPSNKEIRNNGIFNFGDSTKHCLSILGITAFIFTACMIVSIIQQKRRKSIFCRR